MPINFNGIILGLATFLIIGIFHPQVIKAEYYFGVRFWIVFLICGLIATTISLLIADNTVSTILGVFGFTCFWSIKEMFEQVKRVKEGRFPKNPKKK